MVQLALRVVAPPSRLLLRLRLQVLQVVYIVVAAVLILFILVRVLLYCFWFGGAGFL